MFTRVDDATALDGTVIRYQAKIEHGLGEISTSRNAIMFQGVIVIETQEQVNELMQLLLKCVAHKKHLERIRFQPGAEPLTEEEAEKAVAELHARAAAAKAQEPPKETKS